MKLRAFFLGTVAFAALASPAFADDASIEKRLDDMQHMIEAQQKQIEAQKSQIGELRHALSRHGVKTVTEAGPPAPAPQQPPPQIAEQDAKIDDLMAKFDVAQSETRLAKQEQPVWSLTGGRPTITSPDGRFSLAIRAIAQYDTAYYMQSAQAQQLAAANGPDLSSGANFRRVQLGLQGVLFGDWSYNFNYDFAGSGGTETPGHIQSVYVEYDGLKPFAVRIGAFPPAAGLEDNTGSADTIFLERNSPSDLARNIAGGDGRDALSVLYAGDTLFAALSYTGDKIQDAAVFDEQQALLGRLSTLAYSDSDMKVVLSANGSYVFKLADGIAGANPTGPITLSDPPELTVDNTGTKFISSGSLNAKSVTEWGLEAGAQWRNWYGQAGYFGYDVDQRAAGAPAYSFDGWYAQTTWVLTGESRNYSVASGAFSNPRPRVNFSLAGDGWGAWEVAARYSDLNLNDNAGVPGAAVPANGLRGGDQRIWSMALNWYPNAALKFALQWQNIDIDRIGTIPAGFGHGALSNAQVGQKLNTVSFRSQIAF